MTGKMEMELMCTSIGQDISQITQLFRKSSLLLSIVLSSSLLVPKEDLQVWSSLLVEILSLDSSSKLEE